MKKILGSPIDLGEVNLTVDNRVRRNIKEYFGNVDNNSFIVQPVIDGTPPDIDNSKLKISIIADETHLNKVFIIEKNGVKTHFKPITKVGNKLESETRVMLNSLREKLFPPGRIDNKAKLPTTSQEIKQAEEWETKQKNKLEEENKTDGVDIQEVAEECDDDLEDACDVSEDCKLEKIAINEQKRKDLFNFLIVLVGVPFVISLLSFFDIYAHRHAGFCLWVLNWGRKKENKIEQNPEFGKHYGDHDVDLFTGASWALGIFLFLLLGAILGRFLSKVTKTCYSSKFKPGDLAWTRINVNETESDSLRVKIKNVLQNDDEEIYYKVEEYDSDLNFNEEAGTKIEHIYKENELQSNNPYEENNPKKCKYPRIPNHLTGRCKIRKRYYNSRIKHQNLNFNTISIRTGRTKASKKSTTSTPKKSTTSTTSTPKKSSTSTTSSNKKR
jgi:hypothetical protein